MAAVGTKWSPERTPATSHDGGTVRPTAKWRLRGGERGRRCPEGQHAHPERVREVGGGRGGLTATESWRQSSVGGGDDGDERGDFRLPSSSAWRRRRRRPRRCFCPWPICSGRLVSTAAVGGVSVSWRHGSARSRVPAGGRKRRGRRSCASGRCFLTSRGARREGGAVERPRWGGNGARVSPVATVTIVLTVGTHCQCFNLFPFYLNPARFRHLIEALN